MIGLTSFITKNPPMLPRLNRRRAQFVLTKIDETLAWEQRKEVEKDTRFVELGDICAKCARESTGVWKTCCRSMSFWSGAFRNQEGRRIT